MASCSSGTVCVPITRPRFRQSSWHGDCVVAAGANIEKEILSAATSLTVI